MPTLKSFSATAALAALLVACGAAPRQFAARPVLWEDDDRRPFRPQPEPRYVPRVWDAADNMLFRPAARAFAFETHGESVNVNALDEVPSSSWFVNRIGRRAMTPTEVARGSCGEAFLAPVPPFTVVAGKSDGATSGFTVEDHLGRTFLFKSDRAGQPTQASAAEAVVSALYHAAGYRVPCNRVTHFRRADLTLAADAEIDRTHGDVRPMTEDDVDEVLAAMVRDHRGRHRAAASLFLEGTPLGPWDYRGIWDPDLNDAVPHQDRRELRGMRLLNAWVGHWDARQHNTMSMWHETGPPGAGYVAHYLVDFGDCFGFVSGSHRRDIRQGHSEWLDTQHLVEDALTFGLITRPWDVAERGPTWPIFGYFDVEHFDPEGWRPNYFNGAFERMTERDAAWMARIVARFTEAHIARSAELARLEDDALRDRLTQILVGRRARILERYLTRLSPLARPRLTGGALCLEDVAVSSGIRAPNERERAAILLTGDDPVPEPRPVRAVGEEVCVALGAFDDYARVRVALRTPGRDEPAPLEVHLWSGDDGPRIVGLVRLSDGGPSW